MTNSHLGRAFRKLVFAGALTAGFAVNAQPADAGLQPGTTNHVLSLDGDNSYVELPSNIFAHLTEATVEGRVKWQALRFWSRFFDFGEA